MASGAGERPNALVLADLDPGAGALPSGALDVLTANFDSGTVVVMGNGGQPLPLPALPGWGPAWLALLLAGSAALRLSRRAFQ